MRYRGTVLLVRWSPGAVLAEHFWGLGWPLAGVDCRAPENRSVQQLNDILHCGQLCHYNISSSHRCLLVEIKLCNVITCIGGKTGGGAGRKLGVAAPGPSLQPRPGGTLCGLRGRD